MLSTKFSLGLLESMVADRSFQTFFDFFWKILILTKIICQLSAQPESRKILYTAEIEGIVLIENRHNTLPLRFPSSSGLRFRTLLTILRSFPSIHQFGDDVFFNAPLKGISPLESFTSTQYPWGEQFEFNLNQICSRLWVVVKQWFGLCRCCSSCEIHWCFNRNGPLDPHLINW